jgi:hypothetical protein
MDLRRILSIMWVTGGGAKVGVRVKRDFTRKIRHENDTLYFDQLIIHIPRLLKQNKIIQRFIIAMNTLKIKGLSS